MHIIDLSNSRWTLEACGDTSLVPVDVRGRRFEAGVPGCVHTDLIRAGIIGHPNIAFNEEACQWIGRTDWRYQCRFNVDTECWKHDRIDLVFDGLDTIARIELNGRHIGNAMNMHHVHRLDMRSALRTGENELIMTLCGPVSYVEERERQLGVRPVNGDWTPYCYMRKMASNFQWDWGPKVATCGIWRGARVEAWSGARIANVRPATLAIADGEAVVRVEADVEGHVSGMRMQAKAMYEGATHSAELQPAHADGRWIGEIAIELPRLWWPRGCGDQPLYQLQVELSTNGRTHHEWNGRFGVRTTRLIRNQDQHGESFAIEVNDVPIFCRGANWIPEGLFPEDQSPSRVRKRVQQAADANFNMLRVWGGGTYEQAAFHEACDERGIMVWQDFMFACATYPEDVPYPELIEREAREAVSRLAHLPSIVLWCGGNENVLGYESWGWKQQMQHDQHQGGVRGVWGERYYFDILRRVVEELDPSRPYWPDSPHSSVQRTSLHPNDADHGDRHTWDAKVEQYRNIVPRFCSEFGHQSPPCWATMNETWGEDQLQLDSPAMMHRQRATGGNDVWYGSNIMGGRWRTPRDFDEWLYQAHLLQARAISLGIEWMRANQPRCMGALFWQFNDAWAGHSWSCIDSAGRRKPLWYAARRSFAPRLLTFQPVDGALCLCVVNETPEAWDTTLQVRRFRLDDFELAERYERVVVPARTCWRSKPVLEIFGSPFDNRTECLVADAAGSEVERAWWFHDQDALLQLPTPAIIATARRIAVDQCELSIRADTLIRDAVFAVDRLDPDAEIDDNLLTLLPGEQRSVRIRTNLDLPCRAWISPPVFRCANEFSLRA